MNEFFDRALEGFTKHWEGIDAEDPHDRGGRTRFGISQAAHPEVDVPSLTWPEAKAIYRRVYWDPLHLDEVNWPLSLAVFDWAVHSGANRAGEALAHLPPHADPVIAARDLTHIRALFLLDLVARNPTQEKFLHGWMRRIVDMLRTIQQA